MAKKIFIVLLVIFALHLGFRIFENREEYTTKFSARYWEKRYLESQWVVPNSQNAIGDDGLYIHAGWEYIHGKDPILVNSEVPPLGKYLIGLTALVFNNVNIFALLTGLFALGSFYLLNTQIFKNKLLAFIPVFLFSFEPLFYSQLSAPFLDSLQLGFLCLSLYFVLRKNYWLSSLMLGGMGAAKFTYLTPFVAAAVFAYLFFQKDRFSLIKQYVISLVVVPLVLLVSYLRFFILGHSLREFAGLQKYIVVFYSSGAKTMQYGMVFPMIFFNTWKTWWGETLKIDDWRITWPLISLLTIASASKYKKILKDPILLCIVWSLSYLCFLIITPVWPRYLLLLLPFLYNISIWFLASITDKRLVSKNK